MKLVGEGRVVTSLPPNVRPPGRAEIAELAERYHFAFSDAELDLVREHLAGALEGYEDLEGLAEPDRSRVDGDRDPGYRPDDAEDPLNAFVTRCVVRGADAGPLDGVRVGLKDNIPVAGVRMTNGSRLFPRFVPARDAEVVRRLLDAGATIVGKTTMDELAHTGTGETPANGPVRNPHDPDHLAGGSSGGSAAAVVEGTVDVAVGTDTGGSVRIPASWCGCVGLKPSSGLVPFDGITGLAPSLDHAGPLAGTVADCARILDVLAGESAAEGGAAGPYTAAVRDRPDEVSVAKLGESFGFEDVAAAVAETVHGALDAFADRGGASVSTESVPLHEDGLTVYGAVASFELAKLVENDGLVHSRRGRYDVQRLLRFADARRARGNELPFRLKASLVLGRYLAEEYGGRHYAEAQNLRETFRRAYDEVLSEYDVVAMPATPTTAMPVDEDLTAESLLLEHVSNPNSAQFNLTGHPAITVPCGTVDGLPVGLMFVGSRGEDATVLGVARAFEATVGPDGA
jgi:amidase